MVLFQLCFMTVSIKHFYLFISIYKAIWSNRQGKRLVTYETSKKVSSKPARGR